MKFLLLCFAILQVEPLMAAQFSRSWKLPEGVELLNPSALVSELDARTAFRRVGWTMNDESAAALLARSSLPGLESQERQKDGKIVTMLLDRLCLVFSDATSPNEVCFRLDAKQNLFVHELSLMEWGRMSVLLDGQMFRVKAVYQTLIDRKWGTHVSRVGNLLPLAIKQTEKILVNFPVSLLVDASSSRILAVDLIKDGSMSEADAKTYLKIERSCSRGLFESGSFLEFVCERLDRGLAEAWAIRFRVLDDQGVERDLVLRRPQPLRNCEFGLGDVLRCRGLASDSSSDSERASWEQWADVERWNQLRTIESQGLASLLRLSVANIHLFIPRANDETAPLITLLPRSTSFKLDTKN